MNHTVCEFPLAYRVIVPSLLAITTILSPILNILICITILGSRKLHSAGNILIVNLAASDAIIAAVLAPLEIVYIVDFPSWPLKRTGTYILNSAWLFSLVSPFVIVSVITIERYKTIKSFLHSREQIPKSILLIITVSIWLYSIGAVSLMTAYFNTTSGIAYEWNVPYSFYYPFLCIHIVIPLCLVSFTYSKIYKLSKQTSRGTTTNQESFTASSSSDQISKREFKLAKTLAIVIGLLFLVWIPVLIIEVFYAVLSHSCVIEAAGPVSVWLSASNGVMNPIIYFYRNPSLRNQAKRVLRLKRRSYQVNQN